ncbi:MAG: hypothetical protein A2020_12555 [Lentisphaerae bacterium GWF2_45_14]|nr:MAG: hypothetical protein A2020_12555 [Lentisphaerae bacterium GWF2_45_14]
MLQCAVILSGLMPSAGMTAGIAVIIVFYLASGFAAATFSEMKHRSRLVHFAGGLLLPLVYPAFVYFFLPKLPEPVDESAKFFDEKGQQILTEAQKLTKKFVEKTGGEYIPKLPVKKEDEEVKTTGVKSEPETDEIVFDHKYINSLATDSDGNHLGPYIVGLNDGRYIEAVRLLDAYADVFELEICGPDEKMKKIRLPYNKISSCELKSEWMDGTGNAV